MHPVLALEQGRQRGLGEMILHLEKMDQLRLPPAALNDVV
jgi:hypothetical protein